MNLRDLKYLIALADMRHFGKAADACFVSQPTLSTQVRKLEEELGVELFQRQGKRFVAVTDAGKEILAGIDRVLSEIAGLKAIGEEYAHEGRGHLTVAVTHTQARYALPKVVTAFKRV